VEDTAQAHGARLRGRRVGGIGDVGCFSFYPTKNLGAWGDGGAIVTDDAELAERVRLLRSHGEKPRYHHRVPGTTARLDALQAAILRIKLQRLDECNDRRRELGTRLAESLRGSSVEVVERPFEGADHVYHLFVVRSSARDQLRAHLAERGVATAVHYPFAIHRTPAYADLGLGPGSLPVSEDHANRICSLPLWPGMTLEEADTVAEAVWSFGAARPRTRFAPGSQDQTIVSRS
jgi:dTDP-3-amino-3,4,6-trideoxy-alpha-D-glucose transaminase